MTEEEVIRHTYGICAVIAERHVAALQDEPKLAAVARSIAREIRWAQGSRKPRPDLNRDPAHMAKRGRCHR